MKKKEKPMDVEETDELEEEDSEEVEFTEDEQETVEEPEIKPTQEQANQPKKKFLEYDFPQGMWAMIKEYLLSFNDGNFQEKLHNSTQSFEQLKDYIMREAKKYLGGISGHIDNEIVYGWAVHFIDENIQSQVSERPIVIQAISTNSVTKPKKKIESIASENVQKPEKPKEFEQLSIFDF